MESQRDRQNGDSWPLPDARAGKGGPCHSDTCRDRELAPKPFPDGPVAVFKGRRVPEERELPELLGSSIPALWRPQPATEAHGAEEKGLALNPAHGA